MTQEILVKREEVQEIKRLAGWLLLFGRRKVGKTFLIKHFISYDAYFTIRRDGRIMVEGLPIPEINEISYFLSLLKSLLQEDKTVVLDEFQRLPSFVFDELASFHPRGKIIFSGSSFRVVKKIFGTKSPLLGLAGQYPLGLIRPKDILRELAPRVGSTAAVEMAPFLRDAWTLSFFRKEKTLEFLYDLLASSKATIPALVGEIFTEEERELTKIYEGIIRSLGAGEWDYRTIASILSQRKLIEKADSSLVLPFIKNLREMGLVEELPLLSQKKLRYRLLSPIMEGFYYLDDRYHFEERSISLEEIKPTVEKIIRLAVQNFIADFFAQHYQGRKEYLIDEAKEIDFIITRRGKSFLIGEVKWGNYDTADLKKFLLKTKYLAGEKVFITKTKKAVLAGVRVLDAEDLVSLVQS